MINSMNLCPQIHDKGLPTGICSRNSMLDNDISINVVTLSCVQSMVTVDIKSDKHRGWNGG